MRLHYSGKGVLFILAATAGNSICDSSLRPTLSVILHQLLAPSRSTLLLNDIDRKLPVLLDLILQSQHEALCKTFPVKELDYLPILFLIERFPDSLKSLSAQVAILIMTR